MSSSRAARAQHSLPLALLLSGTLHLLFLVLPRHEPVAEPGTPPPLKARLRPPAKVEPTPVAAAPTPARGKPAARKPLLTAKKSDAPSHTRSWSVAEKAEMDNFLDELAKAPKPTLAQRSLAMAREQGRQMAAQDGNDDALLELRPNAPPIHPFSLEGYLDGMLRRLNRSAVFVRRELKNPGVRSAALQFRLNPDGTLKSLVVLNAADRAEEIAYIKAIIERSLPFSPFPPDIDKAARSLGITICIRPGSGDGDMGFTRMRGNRC